MAGFWDFQIWSFAMTLMFMAAFHAFAIISRARIMQALRDNRAEMRERMRFRDRVERPILRHAPLTAMLVGFVFFALCSPGGAIPVYDCQHRHANTTIVDLHEAATCPDPINDYEPAENITVQILQTDTERPVRGYSCSITITREVTRCGFNSLTYGKLTTEWARQVEMTPEECRKAVDAQEVSVDGRIFKVELGTALDAHYFSHGGVSSTGRCEVEDFVSGGLAFHKSYETTYVKAAILTVNAIANAATDTIRFSNGLIGRWKDEVLRDAFHGTIIWTADQPPCSDTVSEVYSGVAKIHRRIGTHLIQGAVIMVAGGQSGDQYAGLVIKKATSLCDTHCYATQIPGIEVCVLREGDRPLPPHTFKASFKQEQAGIQTQLGHLHLGTNMRMHARFEQVQTDLCELERKVLHGRLQALKGDNPYALADLYGPGHEVVVAGAAAYVTQCVVIDAQKADFPNCTEEVPVSVNGTTKFADPITWVLRDFPTVVPCSDIMPVRWLIQGQWFCANPRLTPCHNPRQLETTSRTYRPTGDITEGLGRTVYTRAQRDQHTLFIQAWMGRKATVAKNANTAVSNSYQPGILGSGMTKEDVENTKWAIAAFLNPLIPYLGEFWTYFSGLLIGYIFFSVLFACLYRVVRTYLDYGCGLWCFGAVFNTIFTMARTGPALAKATSRITREGMVDEFPMPSLQDRGRFGTRRGRQEDDVEAGRRRSRDPAPSYDQIVFGVEDERPKKSALELAHMHLAAAEQHQPLLAEAVRYARPVPATRQGRAEDDASAPAGAAVAQAAALPDGAVGGSPNENGLPTASASTQVHFGRRK